MKPLISILTPTFNHGKYIQTCIESVMKQTYPHWEMIIVDDGSTDDTPEIVDRYQDSRIVYLRKEHRGIDYLGDNYNHAFEISNGELMLILEGDDYIPIHRLETQKTTFRNESVLLSHGEYAYVFGDKIAIYPTPYNVEVLRNQPIGSALKAFLAGYNPIGTQSVMVRKSALREIGGFTQPKYLPLVDYPTWMKLALRGRFEFIPQVLGFWRRHPLSISMNRNAEIFKGFIRYCDEFIACHSEDVTKLGLTNAIKNRGSMAYLSLSWISLSEEDWESAISLAKESWKRREALGGSFKMKVMIAMISGYLNIDLPSYLKKVRKKLIQKKR